MSDHFDLDSPVFFITIKFDIASHTTKMKGAHPDWTNRQCRNLLYWQGSVRKELKNYTESLIALSDVKLAVTYIPEAMGVDVFGTCANLEIPIERNPQHYVHKIAMLGRPNSNVTKSPGIAGAGVVGYKPFQDETHEPESISGMILYKDW